MNSSYSDAIPGRDIDYTKGPDPNCENCDGRGCMGCVFREYDHDCQDDCPFCCEVAEINRDFTGKTRIAELEGAIRHVLRYGKLGKRSERRLREVLR